MTARTTLFWLITGLACLSCKSPRLDKPVHHDQYYPLHAFFQAEKDSLERANPRIQKQVSKDGAAEQKTLQNIDWTIELGPFLSVDISKPVYQGAFQVISTDSTLTYRAIDESIDIRQITIQKDTSDLVTGIIIDRKTDNLLYQNTERLTYIPAVQYSLDKSQKILFLGSSRYQITSVFDHSIGEQQ